jgi:hypothetical protein
MKLASFEQSNSRAEETSNLREEEVDLKELKESPSVDKTESNTRNQPNKQS